MVSGELVNACASERVSAAHPRPDDLCKALIKALESQTVTLQFMYSRSQPNKSMITILRSFRPGLL